jgi:hypothetical protein
LSIAEIAEDLYEVHSSEVGAGNEEVRIPRQCLRGEETAIRQAPDADTRRIDVGTRLQIFPGGEDVLVLGVAAGIRVRGVAERPAIPDAAPVVHREHHVALIRQPLVVRVRPVVELHVVIAGQHLPDRPAVHEDHRRTAVTGLEVAGQEELVMNL